MTVVTIQASAAVVVAHLSASPAPTLDPVTGTVHVVPITSLAAQAASNVALSRRIQPSPAPAPAPALTPTCLAEAMVLAAAAVVVPAPAGNPVTGFAQGSSLAH